MNCVYVSMPENIDTYFDDIRNPSTHTTLGGRYSVLLASERSHNLSSSFWRSNIILSARSWTRSSALQGSAFDNLDKTTIF